MSLNISKLKTHLRTVFDFTDGQRRSLLGGGGLGAKVCIAYFSVPRT